MFNTDYSDYNCGGFALETFSWYVPQENYCYYSEDVAEIVYAMFNKQKQMEQIYRVVLERDVNYMINEFSGRLRQLKSLKDPLRPEEKLIAYRLSLPDEEMIEYEEDWENDIDFHFRVMDDDNKKWFEKCGENYIQECDSNVLEPWKSSSCAYVGPVAFMALQKI